MSNPAVASHRLTPSLVLVLIGLLGVCSAYASAQVECTLPSELHASSVQGQVFDITGAPLSGIVVSLTADNGSSVQATTSASGRFQFAPLPGHYVLKVVAPMFQMLSVGVTIVQGSQSQSHPETLRIILGLQGSYCSFVTTSKREFNRIIRANNKRLKEKVQQDATQK